MSPTIATPTFLGIDLTELLVSGHTQSFDLISPLDAKVLASIPAAGPDEVTSAVHTARSCQPRWARVPVTERAHCLLRLHDLLLDHQADLLDLICRESGKSRMDAYQELVHLALTARYYGRRAPALLRTRRGRGVLPGLTRIDLNRNPKGVVGLITPWNYPLSMAMCDGLAALVAGNTVVAKPDSQTVLTALAGSVLLHAAGVPAEAWQVIAGPGRELGPTLVAATDMLCFTGSTATGRLLATTTGAQLKSISAELGGKNALIVRADADLARAAAGAVHACFDSAGQLCMHIERILVDQRVHDDFRDEFVARVREMRLAPGLDWANDMGTLASPAQLAKVQAHLDDAVAHGATVLTGGRARPELAPWFFEPTVLTDVADSAECHLTETFGPLAALYPVKGDAAAIRLANRGRQGLNAAIFTGDPAAGRAMARKLRAGTVNINEGYAAAIASIDAPMGGMGDSGMGRRHGAEGLYRFTETQSVATQRLIPISSRAGLPAERFAGALTGGLRVLRRLPIP